MKTEGMPTGIFHSTMTQQASKSPQRRAGTNALPLGSKCFEASWFTVTLADSTQGTGGDLEGKGLLSRKEDLPPKRAEFFQELAQKRSKSQKWTTGFKKKCYPCLMPMSPSHLSGRHRSYESLSSLPNMRCSIGSNEWLSHTSYTTFGVRRTNSILQMLWDQKPRCFHGSKAGWEQALCAF